MQRLLWGALGAAWLLIPTTTQTWWDMGHMAVAAIAYDQLLPAVRDRVVTLLRLNPDFDQWVAGAPADQRDRAAFIHAATWADDIKRRSDYERGSIAHDRANAAANIGYRDHKAHDYWHFVDLSFSPDGTPGREPDQPNALTQIEAFKKALASDVNDEVKSYDLVWLVSFGGPPPPAPAYDLSFHARAAQGRS